MNSTHLNALYDLLRSLTQYMDIHSRSLHKESGVTGPQLSILTALSHQSPLNVSALAKRVHLSIGTISGTINRLEKNGLIVRTPHGRDRRKVFFQLTPKGQSILENGSSPLPLNFIRNFENGVPEWEKYMILSSLQRLISLMEGNRDSRLVPLVPNDTAA